MPFIWRSLAVTVAALATTARSQPVIGPFNTSSAFYPVAALDSTRREAWVVWPETNDSNARFPLLTYLHGAAGGGIDLLGYTEHFIQVRSGGKVHYFQRCDHLSWWSAYSEGHILPLSMRTARKLWVHHRGPVFL